MDVLLDTNVWLRSVDLDDALCATSVGAMQRLQDSGHTLVAVPQVFYEFWVVATRPVQNNGLGLSPSEARVEIVAIQKLCRFLKDERAVYTIWEQLVERHSVKGKPAHDARLVAAMLRHSVGQLLTYNTTDFKRYSEIKALSPIDILDGADLV